MPKEPTIDLSLSDALTISEASKYPCFGGCGKSWEEADGGWFGFEKDGTSIRPSWYCDACSQQRSAPTGMKDDSPPSLLN